MIRQTEPGERLSDNCGHHCGIRSAADEGAKLTFIGHCGCDECCCPLALSGPDPPVAPTGYRQVPMCDLTGMSYADQMLDRDPVILAIDQETIDSLAADGL